MQFISIALLIFSAVTPSWARPGQKGPAARPHSLNSPVKRQAGCATASTPTLTAPKKNIFQGLTDLEFADVTIFLHQQKALNLTAIVNSTAWDNVIVSLDLLQPNKTDALPYLDGGANAPDRYAKATLQFGATLHPYIQEYMVGPLPIGNTNSTSSNGTGTYPLGNTTSGESSKGYSELNYIYNSGRGRQNVYNADDVAVAEFNLKIGSSISDITKDLLNGTALGNANDTLLIAGNDPLIHDGGKVYQWNEFYTAHTGDFFSETVLPSGLQFKIDITGRDASKYAVVGWYYNGGYWTTLEEFKLAVATPGFKKPGPNVDGLWSGTDQAGPVIEEDKLYPPISVQPDGQRFGVDVEEKYVEWMDFSFFISTNKDTGMQLHDIKFKGERIVYEVGLQEAMAHYASADPLHASSAYLDTSYGIGPSTWELVNGFDCPSYAVYLNTTFYESEETHIHPNSLCLFEYDAGYPIQRHLTSTYVSATKNIFFVVRSVATVGNYDYLFEYSFQMDGSVVVTVRASGYIQGSFWSGEEDYGFHIHDNLSGALHEHVLNYKIDLDIKGTKNSLMKTDLVPASVVYPWSDGKAINTMKLDRSFITSEDDSKLFWGQNGATMYAVVNKDEPNQLGEYPGYRIMPYSGNIIYLTIQNSTALGQAANWAPYNLYAVKQHDTEPRSAYPFNNNDVEHPVVDFNKFFDGESLDQEDLVLYFNLGMHHVPNTADLPNTVFTTAQSSIIIAPQNYLPGDASRQTIHQVRVDFSADAKVIDQRTFGTVQPTCALDMSVMTPDLHSFVGEIIIPKFPYDPLGTTQTNPGG